MLRFAKMNFLRKSLRYLRLKEYDIKKLEAMKTLQKKKEDYVLQQLHQFDKQI
jgi:hypothetical protein